MNLSINNLIANKIVDYGLEQTDEFNWTVDLNEIFDDNTIKYINNNFNEIKSNIIQDERVLDLDISNDNQSFDMVFAWAECLDDFGKEIYKYFERNYNDFDYEDVIYLELKLSDKKNKFEKQLIENYIFRKEKSYER